MRYQNWDVLLFSEGSKIPVQEFKTGCFVIQDPESAQLQAAFINSLPYPINHTIPIQLPTVTSFVPKLPPGFPFRVSVHSWESPRPSRATESSMHHNEVVVFEARVFIDGCCVAGTLFKQKGPWPQVIDTSSQFDKNGNHDNLRFPPFHEEMLTQNWWSAGESVGRVKVVIAEGFAKENHKSPFERVKNIISFSFQHAPLDVLESSGIAWPNPGMWYQPSQPFYNASSLSPRKTRKEGPDAHGHTPRRRDSYARSFGDVNTAPVPIPSHIYKSMPPPAVPGRGPLLKDPYWSAPPSMPDPFLDNSQGPSYESFAGRSGSEDLSMPDYSHSITPASSRNISGSNNMHRKPPSVTEPIGDDQYDMLINVISPRKDGMSGTFAPANTRRSSTVSTPNIVTRPSAAAEARAASYAQGHSRTVSFREPGPSTNRQTSDISMKSRYSEGAVESEGITEVNIHSKPAGSVKGKKEGRGSDLGAKQREISTDPIGRSKKENAKGTGGSPSTLSESKRKRTLTVSETKIMVKDGDVQSSPTRKVSRRESHGAQPVITIDDLTDEDVEVRAPLGILENV